MYVKLNVKFDYIGKSTFEDVDEVGVESVGFYKDSYHLRFHAARMRMRRKRGIEMTYRYLNLAAGRKKKWKDVNDTVPCDMYGTVLSFNSADEEMFGTWTKKVIDYEIKDKVMYCRLEGVIA